MTTVHKILILAALSLWSAAAFSQENFEAFSKFLSPEKLYLQTDREVYCVGDTLWFSGYLRNASGFAEYKECNFIYVEILASLVESDVYLGQDLEQEKVRVRVKVKKTPDGGFDGYIPIPDNLNSGIAVVRAYSYWMLNKEVEYMFNKNIEIRNPLKDDYYRTMKESEVRETHRYTELGMSNPFDKKVSRKEKKPLLEFFPEGGSYCETIPEVFGVRATGEEGTPASVGGEIIADGQRLGQFRTDERGLARISLCVPAGCRDLYARFDDGTWACSLPLPAKDAVLLSCTPLADRIKAEIKVQGPALAGGLLLFAFDKSEIYYKGRLSPTGGTVELPYDQLLPGINAFAVADHAGNVYAVRPFFVSPENSVSVELEESGSTEQTKCRLSLKRSDGTPVSGCFSISVTDAAYSPYDGSGYNLVSWTYLGSELKSFVEDSWRYFDTQIPLEQRISDADMLMLAQGWDYYPLDKILSGKVPLPLCGKEYTQSLSGTIHRPLGKRNRKAVVSFLAQGIGYSSIHQLDSLGTFELSGLNFPQGTQFLVSTEGLGGNRFFSTQMDNDVFARMHSYRKYKKYSGYDDSYKVDAMPLYYDNEGHPVLTLNSAYIVANKNMAASNISPFPGYNFKPGQYRTVEQLKPYETYDIPGYVVSNFPGVRIDTTMAGEYSLLCRTNKVSSQMGITSGWEPIIIYLDRMESSYEEILSYTIADLAGLAFVSGSDAARFGTLRSETSPLSVLMLKTKPNVKTATNVVSIRPLGWQLPLEWSSGAPSTLYWTPGVKTDSRGTVEFSYRRSLHHAENIVVIEGISDDGLPVSFVGRIGN